MEKDIKVEIRSLRIIKPSSPTSHNNRNLKLSLIDQVMSSYGSMVFFYPSTSSNTNNGNSSSFEVFAKSKRLEESLSKTLVHFYPLAGRVYHNISIDCNDEGIFFLGGQINCKLLDFLEQPDLNLIHGFIPKPNNQATISNPILLVQLTGFSCGGIALGVSISHKIADGKSLSSFIQSWSSISRECDIVSPPKFIGHCLFPPVKDSPIKRISLVQGDQVSLSTRRFVFSASNLATLKAKTCSKMLHDLNPTKVEIVSALLFKCAIAASQSLSGCAKLPSVLNQTVNLRNRLVPPLENTVGNIIWSYLVKVEESKVELHEVVAKLRKGLIDFLEGDKTIDRLQREEGFSLVSEFLREEYELSEKGINHYMCTSLCKFQLYQMDFGWGEPIWAISPMLFKNMFVLTDTKLGEGIEVWATLEEKHMAYFESNEELLEFAFLNPSVASDVTTSCRM